MKKQLLFYAFLLYILKTAGQETTHKDHIARNTIYVEGFGQGLVDAISFDRLTHLDKGVKRSWSAGISIYPVTETMIFALPVSYNFIFGSHNHHLEAGLGFTPMIYREQINNEKFLFATNTFINPFIGYQTNIYTYFTPKFGYRYQRKDGGIFIRLTITPPVACVNLIGQIKSNDPLYDPYPPRYEVFEKAAFFPYFAFPWLGASVGWTFRR